MRVILTRREPLDSADGVSIFIVALAQAFVDLRHEVRLVVGSLGSKADYERRLSPRLDLPMTALSGSPLKGVASIRAWLRAKRLIDGFAPDLVIHSEAIPLPLSGTVIHVVHDLEPRHGPLAPIWRSIRRFSARRGDYVIATTSELRDALARDLRISRERILLIPKCIDLGAYRGAGLAARERAILHAGTLGYKDPLATIRAFARLDDPSVRLYITGELDTPIKAAIAALPERIRGSVIAIGEADGEIVRKLHGTVRVASFPTRYTIPVASATVMEAIGSGTPIVGSPDLSRDVLSHQVNGIMARSDSDNYSAALRSVLDDDALWARLSAGARQMAARFDALRIARRYVGLATEKPRQADLPAPARGNNLQGEFHDPWLLSDRRVRESGRPQGPDERSCRDRDGALLL